MILAYIFLSHIYWGRANPTTALCSAPLLEGTGRERIFCWMSSWPALLTLFTSSGSREVWWGFNPCCKLPSHIPHLAFEFSECDGNHTFPVIVRGWNAIAGNAVYHFQITKGSVQVPWERHRRDGASSEGRQVMLSKSALRSHRKEAGVFPAQPFPHLVTLKWNWSWCRSSDVSVRAGQGTGWVWLLSVWAPHYPQPKITKITKPSPKSPNPTSSFIPITQNMARLHLPGQSRSLIEMLKHLTEDPSGSNPQTATVGQSEAQNPPWTVELQHHEIWGGSVTSTSLLDVQMSFLPI